MVVPLVSTASTTAPPADAASSPSPQPVLGPATNSEETGKGQQTYAAVSPTEPGRASALSVELIIARELQAELKRVGCDPGNTDGDWNAASRRALEAFNKHAGTKLEVRVANLNALSVIRSMTSRICPLACDRGYRVRGDHCVKHRVAGDRGSGSSFEGNLRHSSTGNRVPVVSMGTETTSKPTPATAPIRALPHHYTGRRSQ